MCRAYFNAEGFRYYAYAKIRNNIQTTKFFVNFIFKDFDFFNYNANIRNIFQFCKFFVNFIFKSFCNPNDYNANIRLYFELSSISKNKF